MSEPITKSRPPRVGSRRRAREIAVKVSYAREMRDCSLEEVINDPLVTGGELPPAFTVRLLSHVDEHVEFLDELIRDRVHRWEFHRIAVIDRIILRLATSELVYFPDVPPKVSINEAIEIAKEYSTEQSSRFVNGILDAVFTDITSGKIVPVAKSMTDS